MPIDITSLTGADIGRGVVYRSKGGDKVEDGIIKNFNERYVFVVYRGSFQSAATDPNDLEFLQSPRPGPGASPSTPGRGE